MICVHLIRHGACLDHAFLRGHTDSELSVLGKAQMQAVFSCLPEADWVISSPAKRCLIPVQQYGLSAAIWPEFQERNFGVWDGLSYEAILNRDPEGLQSYLNHPFSFQIPGSESFDDFEKRIVYAFKALLHQAQRHDFKQVWVVTHGGVIRVLLKAILGFKASALFQLGIGLGTTVTLECWSTHSMSQFDDKCYAEQEASSMYFSDVFIQLCALTPCPIAES